MLQFMLLKFVSTVIEGLRGKACAAAILRCAPGTID
jgi:hypothetical protein